MSRQNKPKSFNAKRKCGICSNDFVGATDPNEPVFHECGCVFHEYCLYKYGFSGPSYSCPNDKCSSKTKNAKAVINKNMKLTSENGKLKTGLAEQSINEKALTAENKKLALENKKLISENKKLKAEVAEHRVENETLIKERDKLTWEIAKLKAEGVKQQPKQRQLTNDNPSKKQRVYR